jgi:hypothetical protein
MALSSMPRFKRLAFLDRWRCSESSSLICASGLRRRARSRHPRLRAAPPKRSSILDPYKPYILQQGPEGCWNGVQLYADIKTQGFSGARPTLRNLPF